MQPSLKDRALNDSLSFKIALDGPAASGKGTIGRALASKFRAEYFQSSLLYRNLASLCLEAGIDPYDEISVIEVSKDPELISLDSQRYAKRNEEIGDYASKIAIVKDVRINLSSYQKEFIKKFPRIITEGRDIGTVIAPNSDLKLFITATPEVRAERRYKQLRAEGKDCILREVFDNLVARDRRDESRWEGPLKPASDALIIDSSELSKEEVLKIIENFVLK